ncbi:AAA family ATPase [Bacillus sp. FJAT-29790]|uniref:AAA domain-containing protein n=1 Tax=Bacillus sp. FJAT-29790 TaxID=1895002 RepID=UPI001C22E203|nr:AAA domain-containing protein [Bacillus sp. FJAT-29790]MBU8877369.1 AAA family ATPase [Bacillus sp. FJAT-29790]
MTNTLTYIKEWQKALKAEIQHLKKDGSTRYRIINGRLLSKDASFTYFFDTSASFKVPVGSAVRIEWGKKKTDGRILSSEGKSVIIDIDENLGSALTEVFVLYDPWELLDQLFQRLEEMKGSKRKRGRIKRLMDPSMEAKHPVEKIKSNVHELILRSKYNPVTYVWGPPGTGKTYTLARVAANKYIKGLRVLVLSHSNQAVDVLMAEISIFVEKIGHLQEGDLLRYGSQMGEAIQNRPYLTSNQLIQKHHASLAENKESLSEERRLIKQDLSRSFSKRDSDRLLEIEKKLASVLEKIRQKEIQFLKEAMVIGTTLAKAANDAAIYEKDFDLVIVDEASMAYVPQAAFAVSLAKRAIICGDFKQLPPIATARHPLVSEWLREDVFHQSGVSEWVNDGKLHPHLFLLKEQRRMHPDISAFTNKYIYHSLVGDYKNVLKSRTEISDKLPFPNRASVLVDSSGAGEYGMTERFSKSRMNLWQLFLSFQLIHESFTGGARSIGYVTPYRAQAFMMEQLLGELYEKELQEADIIAATVHRFQGSERDVMIFDPVDSSPLERAGMLLTGKDSERLLNVAITRTKGKFIHVCNYKFVRNHVYQNKTWRKLADHQLMNKQIVTPSEIGTWIKNQHSRLQWMHARKLDTVKGDIHSAEKTIILSIPKGGTLTKEWIEAFNKRGKEVNLTLLTVDHIPGLRTDWVIPEPLSFPFIIIDRQFVWLGLPIEANVRAQPPFVAARLDSKITANYILNQLSERNV